MWGHNTLNYAYTLLSINVSMSPLFCNLFEFYAVAHKSEPKSPSRRGGAAHALRMRKSLCKCLLKARLQVLIITIFISAQAATTHNAKTCNSQTNMAGVHDNSVSALATAPSSGGSTGHMQRHHILSLAVQEYTNVLINVNKTGNFMIYE